MVTPALSLTVTPPPGLAALPPQEAMTGMHKRMIRIRIGCRHDSIPGSNLRHALRTYRQIDVVARAARAFDRPSSTPRMKSYLSIFVKYDVNFR